MSPPEETVPAGREERSAALPLLGQVLRFEAGRHILTERMLDLDEDLFLADHTFIHPEGVKPLEECFAVLPLTMTLEMMAEVAACLAPGLGVIAIENVRAKQWIALDGVRRAGVRVEGRWLGAVDGVTQIGTEAFVGERSVATATIRLAERYRLSVDLQFAELSRPRPFPIEVQRLYTDRYLFHGPRFRSLAGVHQLGDQGITGELVAGGGSGFFASVAEPQMILDPVALDGAGQMFGAIFFGQELYMLPVAIDTIEFYRTSPPPGTRVPIRIQVVEFDREARRVACNMEVQDGQGKVWFRIRGWQDVLFRWGRELLDVQRLPCAHVLAREVATGTLAGSDLAVLLRREVLRDAQIERLARLYLHGDEWAAFQATGASHRRRKEWLMGRIAAKDAMRLYLARRDGRSLLHPSLVIIENDPAGRPVVRLPEGVEGCPALSIAHVHAGAAAAVSDLGVGVDLEAVDAGAGLERGGFATPSEIRLLAEIDGSETPAWTTRLWCAKEAASKVLGTGLRGQPKTFEAVRVQPDGRLFLKHGQPPGWIAVQTLQEDGLILAVATRAEAASAGSRASQEAS